MVREDNLEQEEEEDAAAPIHGDVLEAILSHVPLIYLVPACHVSKSWKRAVLSSLRHCKKPKPWLMVYTQSTRYPYVTATHAYDPRSHVWIEVKQPPIKYVSSLRSSNSNLLYMLSPLKLSFSFDPFHLTWHHMSPPLVWRMDPIVALVGHRIVIAGGACDFDDDPLSVEIYDLNSRTWDTSDSMPSILKDSAASTSFSIASNNEKVFVTEKSSGATYSFDPRSKNWRGPYDLRLHQCMFLSAIGFAGDRLIVVSLVGDDANLKSVKMWEVRGESLERCREIGEMPEALLEKLKGVSARVSSISLAFAGDVVYIGNASEPEVVVLCEFDDGGDVRRWGSVRNVLSSDKNRTERFVFTCASVGIGELQKALTLDNLSFELKSIENNLGFNMCDVGLT